MRNITLKIAVSLLLFWCFILPVSAQDFAKVDTKVKSYPNSFSDIDKFAEKVSNDFSRDDEKARAIFTWIALNVRYDLAAYGVNERPVAYSFKTEAEKLEKQRKFKEELAHKTLKTKKGVCQGYSTLFAQVADRVRLETVIIPGSSKSHIAHIGKQPGKSDHAWNAVKINGDWKLIDVTWAAGAATGNPPKFEFNFNDKYFFTDPDVFFLNHFPDDKRWLLTNKTESDFANLPLYYGNYLMGGYEFVTPFLGTLTNLKSNIIPFKIKNLKPGDRVAYYLSNKKIFKEVHPVLNGETAEFEVQLENNANGYITIYINQQSVAAYRINRA